jgi:DNA ligase 1
VPQFICALLLFLLCTFGNSAESILDAPPLLLAHTASDDVDPLPYLISEKLDGVRAHWDGTMLRFRSGNRVNAPAWFIAKLPQQSLDGELWLGRGRFEQLSGLVRTEQPDDKSNT